eukprot:115781_1
MIDVKGSLICGDLLDNIALINDIDFEQCKFSCVFDYSESCVMVNFIGTNPSKCYLFDVQCTIVANKVADETFISLSVVREHCINHPANWADKYGNKCVDYSQGLDKCSNRTVINDTMVSEIESNANVLTGLTAIDACCECGSELINIDGVSMRFATFGNNENILCEWDNYLTPSEPYKKWNNVYLFNLCQLLVAKLETTIDCRMFIEQTYALDVDFFYCDFADINDEDIDKLYFAFAIDESLSVSYLNNDWFNLTESLLPARITILPVDECLFNLNSTFVAYPCAISSSNSSEQNTCEYQNNIAGCKFSLSYTEVCCDYIDAPNSFVNKTTQNIFLNQQMESTYMKYLKIISFSSFIITTIFMVFIALSVSIKCT